MGILVYGQVNPRAAAELTSFDDLRGCDIADFLSTEARSRVMSSIRSRNTRPEMRVRKVVWSEGYRYRLHVRGLPGTPDLVLSRYRIAVFVHGCFWHQHGCAKTKRPSSNREYWDRKLNRNIARDANDRIRLEEMGWTVKTVWECSLEGDTKILLSELKEKREHRCAGSF